MPSADPPEVSPETVEERLLGGPRRFRRDEVAEAAGVPVEYARRLWRAVGFPSEPWEQSAATPEERAEYLASLGEKTGNPPTEERSNF